MIQLDIKILNSIKNLAFAGFLALILSSCSPDESLKNQVILRINNETISVEEFSQELAKDLQTQEAAFIKDPATIKRIKELLVKRIILHTITRQWAQKNNINVNQKELETEINQIRSQYPNDIEFRKALANERTHFKKWVELLKFSILEKKIITSLNSTLKPIAEKEVKALYEEEKSLFRQPERILLRQIVLNKKNFAEKIYKTLQGSPTKAKFQELAKKYSVAPEARNDGLIGWVAKSTLAIFDKAFRLPIGRISKIHKSDYGFHIFRVEKKQKARYIPFEKAKEKIKRRLFSKREQIQYSSWLEQQIHQSKVYKDERLIQKLKIELKGGKK